ncbi:proton-conducting membrane transporter [Halobellus inordinatus]|uniref:proton-conducting membrane transporter n=1 Tax=Halobellus inordinatus TaxID=1126236 RepID=UPI00210BB45B|nr:proton-conducting membrane transporter [Halobellus inordinatus]
MTTKPELNLGSHLVPGLAAVALFVVMAATILSASFPDPQGFAGDASIVASIGYAMFNLEFGDIAGESFLAALIIIAITLDVALDGSIHLARREGDQGGSSLLADGGRELKQSLFEEDDD